MQKVRTNKAGASCVEWGCAAGGLAEGEEEWGKGGWSVD